MLFFPTTILAGSLVTTLISGGTGTIITTGTTPTAWSGGGGTSAAFDGTTSQASTACALVGGGTSNSGMANFLGKDWGSGVTKKITQLIINAPSDNSFLGGGNTTSWQLDGSNDGSSWTTLDSGTTSSSFGQTITRTSATINTSTAYRYHRVGLSGNGSNAVGFAELRFYEDI